MKYREIYFGQSGEVVGHSEEIEASHDTRGGLFHFLQHVHGQCIGALFDGHGKKVGWRFLGPDGRRVDVELL